MSQADDIGTLVKARLRQAQNVLDAGQILLSQGLYSDSINRVYLRQVREYLQPS